MKLGIFDHLDRRAEPLERLYAERLQLACAAERLGFHGYHVAEHHGTPLGMAPSPNLFLAALSQRTTTLRFGPMVYVLPAYSPLRLAEEIAMLDNLSGGRLEAGVGRSISPHEMGFHGIRGEDGWEHYVEALQVVMTALYEDTLDWDSDRFRFEGVPIELHPRQNPVPLWSAPGSPTSIEHAARYGMNVVSLGPTARVKEISSAYRDAWAEHAGDGLRRYCAVDGAPLVGAYRLVHVAESDLEAERCARPAFEHWFASASKLWRERGGNPTLMRMDTFEKATAAGMMIAGGPATVTGLLGGQADEAGFDYAMLQFAFGDLGHPRELASLEFFAREVAPGLPGS